MRGGSPMPMPTCAHGSCARSPRSKAAVAFPQPAGGEVDVDAVAALTPLHLLVRLLLPVPMCGLVIGKNGTTIRSYAADTNTVIRCVVADDTRRDMALRPAPTRLPVCLHSCLTGMPPCPRLAWPTPVCLQRNIQRHTSDAQQPPHRHHCRRARGRAQGRRCMCSVSAFA